MDNVIEVQGFEVVVELPEQRMTALQAYELGLQLISKAKDAWPYCEQSKEVARDMYGWDRAEVRQR